MADSKISQLTSGAPAQAGDEYVVARSGANYKLTLTNIAASMPPIGATTPNTGSFTSLTNSGNLTFSSTGQRITGDFGNATIANRLAFQNSVTNANTPVNAIPNGTATGAGFRGYGASDPTNAPSVSVFQIGTTDSRIASEINGTASYTPMTFYTGGSERLRIDTAGQIGIGGANYGTSGQVLTSGGSGAAPSWATVAGLPTMNIVTGTSQTAVTNNQYVLTNAAATTVTLPSSPSAGATVYITVANNLTTNVVARNGQNIQSLAEDMTLNAAYAAVQLRFADATRGWVLT
jgi:hypothetical protein